MDNRLVCEEITIEDLLAYCAEENIDSVYFPMQSGIKSKWVKLSDYFYDVCNPDETELLLFSLKYCGRKVMSGSGTWTISLLVLNYK